jgi:cytochrome c biogenesis protein ResB
MANTEVLMECGMSTIVRFAERCTLIAFCAASIGVISACAAGVQIPVPQSDQAFASANSSCNMQPAVESGTRLELFGLAKSEYEQNKMEISDGAMCWEVKEFGRVAIARNHSKERFVDDMKVTEWAEVTCGRSVSNWKCNKPIRLRSVAVYGGRNVALMESVDEPLLRDVGKTLHSLQRYASNADDIDVVECNDAGKVHHTSASELLNNLHQISGPYAGKNFGLGYQSGDQYVVLRVDSKVVGLIPSMCLSVLLD